MGEERAVARRLLKRILGIISVGSLAGCAGLPFAQGNGGDPTPQPVPLYAAPVWAGAAWDLNGDNALSYDEYVEGRLKDIRFIKAPTEEELATLRQTLREEALILDKDKDGRITPQEYPQT